MNRKKNNNIENKKLIKKIWFKILLIVCLIIILIASLIFINVWINKKRYQNDLDRVTKTKTMISNDYKYFDNNIEDLSFVINFYLKTDEIKVSKNSMCSDDEKRMVDTNNCHKIELDNNDSLYISSPKKNKIDKLIYSGNTSRLKYPGKVIGEILLIYSSNINNDDILKMNEEFFTLENFDRNIGLGFVFNHIKFDYIKMDNNNFNIIMRPTEFETQDDYKETDEYKSNYNVVYLSESESEIKKILSGEQEIDSHEVNLETGLVDMNIKYKKSDLSRYNCALDTQELAKKLVGSKYIGSLQFECINDTGLFYYVKVNNINSISSTDIDLNTIYFNSNYAQEEMNIDTLKDLIPSDYKSTCGSFDYKEILRNPEPYKGQRSVWYGKVLQVVSKTSYSADYRIGVSCIPYEYIGGFHCDDVIYVTYSGDGNFIEDDMVNVYGTLEGTKTYTTVLHSSLTIPKISAKYIDLQ